MKNVPNHQPGIDVTVRVNPHVQIKRFGGKTGGRLRHPQKFLANKSMKLIQRGKKGDNCDKYGGFLKWGVTPIVGWFIVENSTKLDDWEVPLFSETTT